MVFNNKSTSPVQRINSEDLQGTIDDKLASLVGSINLFIQSTNSSLNGNLQIPTNITGQINSMVFTTNSNYSPTNYSTFTPIVYKSTLPYQTRILLMGQINIVSGQVQYIANTVVISDWSDINGSVSINFITGLLPNTSYKLTTLAF
jgi:hypothetical protein